MIQINVIIIYYIPSYLLFIVLWHLQLFTDTDRFTRPADGLQKSEFVVNEPYSFSPKNQFSKLNKVEFPGKAGIHVFTLGNVKYASFLRGRLGFFLCFNFYFQVILIISFGFLQGNFRGRKHRFSFQSAIFFSWLKLRIYESSYMNIK